jgi:hypothetical protein
MLVELGTGVFPLSLFCPARRIWAKRFGFLGGSLGGTPAFGWSSILLASLGPESSGVPHPNDLV